MEAAHAGCAAKEVHLAGALLSCAEVFGLRGEVATALSSVGAGEVDLASAVRLVRLDAAAKRITHKIVTFGTRHARK